MLLLAANIKPLRAARNRWVSALSKAGIGAR